MTRYQCPKCSTTAQTAIKADVFCTRCGLPMIQKSKRAAGSCKTYEAKATNQDTPLFAIGKD